jgi:small subunit ribosomal protein S2
MRNITLEELLEAGAHFGHQVTRFNPKARDFVFEAKDNIHIINLDKTREGLLEAGEYVKELAKNGGTLLIVGTKRQAKDIVLKEVSRVKELFKDKNEAPNLVPFYVTYKWIGGIITNFDQFQKNIKKLKDLEVSLQSPEEKAKYTKKEVGQWEKERQRLNSLYEGIRDMQKEPNALFIIDSHLENLAVREATAMNIPTVAITDTNSDPTIIDYAIPANDDAVGSIELITSYIIDAWIEGANERLKAPKKEAKEESKDGEKVVKEKSITSPKTTKSKKEAKKDGKSKPKRSKKA